MPSCLVRVAPIIYGRYKSYTVYNSNRRFPDGGLAHVVYNTTLTFAQH